MHPQAQNLLERADGPVILEHFPDDNPSRFDRPDWVPAVSLPAPETPQGSEEWEASFRADLTLSLPGWDRFKQRFGRTTVGLAGQPPEAWPAFAVSLLDGAPPTHPPYDTALSLRVLAADLKALYGQAVQADGPPASARQVDQWFWRETVGGRFFVPVPWLP